MKKCLNCNSVVKEHDTYCRNCGCILKSNKNLIFTSVINVLLTITIIFMIALIFASYIV